MLRYSTWHGITARCGVYYRSTGNLKIGNEDGGHVNLVIKGIDDGAHVDLIIAVCLKVSCFV